MVGSLLKSPLYFCLAILLTYLMGLWGTSVPLTGDQKVYLSTALEMFEKNEWIIPSLFGEASFLKPPFQYWATILGWKLFGLSIFGALIPSVLALVCSAWLSYRISKKINLRSPELVAILFASTIGSMTYGSTAQMEIWIVFFFLAAWLAVLSSRLFLAFVLVGLMAWVKGPLYPVLWTMSLLVWNLGVIKSRKFWLSLLSGALIGLSWYFLAARTHRQEILNQFLLVENLGKFNTPQGSVFGLWGEFFFSLFPWGVLFLMGCFQKSAREKWKTNQRFYLSYALVSVIFFTLFPYRVNSYFYFLTPLIAMMVSEVDLNFSKRTGAIGAGIYFVLFVFILFVIVRLAMGGWIGMEIPLSLLMSMLVFMAGFFQAQWKYVALASLILVNLIRVSAVQIGERDLAGLKNAFQQGSSEYAYFIDSKDIWHEYGLISSALGHSMQRIYNASELDSFLALGGSVILQPEQQPLLMKNVSCVDWKRLKRRSKFPIEKLLREGIAWGDPDVMRTYRICSTAGQ